MRRDFVFLQPETPKEAVALFQQESSLEGSVVYWGGGTELISMTRTGKIDPRAGIDIKKIPEAAYDIIDVTEDPITIIYDDAQNLAPNLIAEDKTIAIRIPNDDFCFQLLRRFNGSIVSTSANISGMPTPKSFKEISQEVLKGVDYVVNLHREKICNKPSSILKLSSNGVVKIIRP